MGNFTNIAHDDHGLSDEHVEVVMSHPVVAEVAHGEFVRVVVPIPDGVPSLPCALYGPAVGDGPVPESAVREVVRGNRGGPSRMIGLPSRPARNMVIIGIRGGVCFTAYGTRASEPSPMEPWDAERKGIPEADLEAARAFWADHALARL